jgi:hypothetical protein
MNNEGTKGRRFGSLLMKLRGFLARTETFVSLSSNTRRSYDLLPLERQQGA